MKTVTEPLRIYDADNDTTWTIPRQRTNAVMAEVSERWVANVIVPEAVCRDLIRVPFLEPIRTEVGYVLSLCAIFMKHAAPKLDWISQQDHERFRDVVSEWYVYQDELLGRLLAKIDLESVVHRNFAQCGSAQSEQLDGFLIAAVHFR